MKNICFRYIIECIWKYKIVAIGIIAISTLVGLYTGISKAKEIDADIVDTVYVGTIEAYDNTIADNEENLKIAQDQLKEIQEYNDNYVIMKFDPNNIYYSNVQFVCDDGGLIVQYITYFNEGGLKEAISEKTEVPEQYLAELISISRSDMVLSMTTKYYDEATAAKLRDVIEEEMLAHSEGHLVKIDSSDYVRADVNILNTQNGNLDKVRAYQNSIADYERRISDNNNAKEKYITDYKEKHDLDPQIESKPKTVIMNTLFGIVAGIIICIALVMLKYTISNTVKNTEELITAGWNVLGSYTDKKGFDPQLGRMVFDIELLMKDSSEKNLFVSTGECDNEKAIKVIEELQGELKKKAIKVDIGNVLEDDGLKKMSEAGACLIIVQPGRSTYDGMEKSRNYMKAFEVKEVGCLMVNSTKKLV